MAEKELVTFADMKEAFNAFGSMAGVATGLVVDATVLRDHGAAEIGTGLVSGFVGLLAYHENHKFWGSFFVTNGLINLAVGLYDVLTGHV